MKTISWIKCQNETWCPFWNVDLSNNHFDNLEGVYILWVGETVLYIGQGVIKDRLYAHRSEPQFAVYKSHDVRATWAHVSLFERSGVEKYLGGRLNPKIGQIYPENVNSIPVNLPWS